MSGRLVLLAIAILLGLAGWYMWAISMPAKREAQRQNAARADASQPSTERVAVPSADAPLASGRSVAGASMVTAWMDPRASSAFSTLAAEPPGQRPAPGLQSPEWYDVVMRAPYGAIDATPGERTKADANLRDYRRRADALFTLLAAKKIAPAEALIRYRELDLARIERDREILGAARSERLESLRNAAFAALAP